MKKKKLNTKKKKKKKKKMESFMGLFPREQKPSSSFDFMQALKKAKEESLQLMNKQDNDSNRIQERLNKYNLILNPDTGKRR